MAQKTRKSIAKRFKLTGSGKMMRRSANRRHLLRNKSNKTKRKTGQDQPVAEGQAKHLILGLPHGN